MSCHQPLRFPLALLLGCLLVLAACVEPVGDPGDDDVASDDDDAADEFECGDILEDARDGRAYATVAVGDVCWMAENLNVGVMIESTGGGHLASDDGTVEKYCWDDDEGNCDGPGDGVARGGFYEWTEAVGGYDGAPEQPAQGICPDGWHIPSQAGFQAMIAELGGAGAAAAELQVGGGSGLEVLMTGYRCTMTGGFLPSPSSATPEAFFWVSDEQDADNAPLWQIGTGQVTTFSFLKSLGLSVRCAKDG